MTKALPNFIKHILARAEKLWCNYHFSTNEEQNLCTSTFPCEKRKLNKDMNPVQQDAEKPLELSIIGLLIKDAVESPTPKKQNRKKRLTHWHRWPLGEQGTLVARGLPIQSAVFKEAFHHKANGWVWVFAGIIFLLSHILLHQTLGNNCKILTHHIL